MPACWFLNLSFSFFIQLWESLLKAAGGIRRSFDFPGFSPVNPDLHQGTSILVTKFCIERFDLARRFSP